MRSEISGVLEKVKELYAVAMYTHCSGYVQNLISHALELRVISNAWSTIGDVCTFLSRSLR